MQYDRVYAAVVTAVIVVGEIRVIRVRYIFYYNIWHTCCTSVRKRQTTALGSKATIFVCIYRLIWS